MSKAPLIYYVEDDEHIRDLTAYALHQAGMEVRAFHDGDGLVERCEVEPPDAVLLDIMLPGDDGLVLLQALRGNAATENLPVMMLTAKGFPVYAKDRKIFRRQLHRPVLQQLRPSVFLPKIN